MPDVANPHPEPEHQPDPAPPRIPRMPVALGSIKTPLPAAEARCPIVAASSLEHAEHCSLQRPKHVRGRSRVGVCYPGAAACPRGHGMRARYPGAAARRWQARSKHHDAPLSCCAVDRPVRPCTGVRRTRLTLVCSHAPRRCAVHASRRTSPDSLSVRSSQCDSPRGVTARQNASSPRIPRRGRRSAETTPAPRYQTSPPEQRAPGKASSPRTPRRSQTARRQTTAPERGSEAPLRGASSSRGELRLPGLRFTPKSRSGVDVPNSEKRQPRPCLARSSASPDELLRCALLPLVAR